MSDENSFIVVKYQGVDTAEGALALVQDLARRKVVKLKDAVAITKKDEGKIELHQTLDDTVGTGFLKGGLVGVVLAALFGPAGWVVGGAALGSAFGTFDRGIRDKLLLELGENLAPDESALAVLIESADWGTLLPRMAARFTGEIVVQEWVKEHLAQVEKLVDNRAVTAAVPKELSLPGQSDG